jgi:hypothetical protein
MHERVGRALVHLLGRARLPDAASVEHDHPIRQLQRLLLVMGDEHRGDVDLLVQLAQPAPQLLADLGIERAERLVEQKNTRLDGERPCERDALALAAGELCRLALAQRPAGLGSRSTARGSRPARPMPARAGAQAERHVLEHGHVPEQRVALEHEADIALADAAQQRVLAVECTSPWSGQSVRQ